ncbi:frataxin [Nematocida ausubeli]|nr:frataxin [Nematocida ausubeli]KAI5150460.1 frataxin [Nematocida ausubeli]KAI5164222.1 frataxin [Nematocida ausubeli]
MLQSTYESLSKGIMKKIYETIDQAVDSVSLKDNVIIVEVPKAGIFVINRQPSKEEIWLSSPLSGPYHFARKKNQWLDRNGNSLLKIISKEILNEQCLIE